MHDTGTGVGRERNCIGPQVYHQSVYIISGTHNVVTKGLTYFIILCLFFYIFLPSLLYINCDLFHSVSDFDQQKPTKRQMLKMESVLFVPPAAGPSLCCFFFFKINFLILDSEERQMSSFTPSFVCFLDSGSCSLVPPSH